MADAEKYKLKTEKKRNDRAIRDAWAMIERLENRNKEIEKVLNG